MSDNITITLNQRGNMIDTFKTLFSKIKTYLYFFLSIFYAEVSDTHNCE